MPVDTRRSALDVVPFTIEVADEVLTDLRHRIRQTRWPSPAPGAPWSQGTDLDYLRDMLAYWADGFDWRAQEKALNSVAHFTAQIDDLTVHFVHERAASGSGVPLVLTHGWPSTFAELLPVVPLLTNPAAHGIDGPAFDVVIPSLPGYGFSTRPPRPVTMRDTAAVWHRLMSGLGYASYGAVGGDFGSGVATFLALDHPDSVLGLYLSNLELDPYLGQDAPPLSDAERDYADRGEAWAAKEGAYNAVQSTKPQTLGYGLNDSPAGLAAWVLEKWRSWSDSGGQPENRFTRDFLLTTVTLFWITGTITDSMRDYHDNRDIYDTVGATDRVRVPTAVGLFSHEFVGDGTPPRSWAERLYQVHRWTVMPSGGHFAPAEEPRLLAEDLVAFFTDLGQDGRRAR